MKTLLLVLILLNIQSFGFTQIIENIDEYSPFHDNLAAIQKGNQWGFINEEGLLVIDYRDDLVLSTHKGTDKKTSHYPVFIDERCLIKKTINDVNYYGYIDKTGKEIIAPQFLNASNFKGGYAIIIKLSNEIIGYNDVLNKDIISTKLEEFIIDTSGEIVKYLENPRNYIPSKKMSGPPIFNSKFIAPHLVAVKKKDKKWDIYKF